MSRVSQHIKVATDYELDNLLAAFDCLKQSEKVAYRGLFRGARGLVRQYTNKPESVVFGKSECEAVSFTEFWLTKIPELGWATVSNANEDATPPGFESEEWTEYLIQVTDAGRDIYHAYLERRRRQIERF